MKPDQPIRLEGVALDWVSEEKVLGVEHQYVGGVRRAQQELRGVKAMDTPERSARILCTAVRARWKPTGSGQEMAT